MSISKTSGRISNHNSPQWDPPEFGDTAETLAEIPPDPLLQSGSFIDVTNSTAESEEHIEQDTRHNHPTTETEPVDLRHLFVDVVPISVVDTSNCVEVVTPVPVPENTKSPAESRPRRGRRRKSEKIVSEVAAPSASSETPDWLPPGWFVEDRVRCSGATAGLIDKYYVEPVSGHKFRSKKEVHHFLVTGTKRKRGSTENPGVDILSLGSSRGHKRKRSGSRVESSALNFDFDNVPEKIDWVLTDSSQGSWNPFIGDEKVTESIKREWATAFESLADRNTGGRVF